MNPQTRFECLRAVLGEAAFDDSRWPEAARLIEDVCGTKGSTLVFGQRYPDDSTQVFLARFFHRGERRQDWEGEYYRVYHPVDERAPRIGRAPAGRIFHVSELYTEAERKTSPTYNEAMLHGQNQNGLNVRLDGPGGSNIIWAFADPTARRGWESGQIERVESLLPHLRRYVLMRAALADAGVLGATLESLLDTGRLAVIQLDHRKRIVETNDRARQMLLEQDGIADRAASLQAAVPGDNARLQELLAQALPAAGGQGQSGSMTLRRPSLLPRLILHVTPVTNRETGYRSQRVAALVLVVDPMDRLRIDPALVQSVLGLSPTETEIAVLLAQGRTLRQIAHMTGRGYNTVRTHLTHTFSKLGVSRQFEVAQLVLALASLPTQRR